MDISEIIYGDLGREEQIEKRGGLSGTLVGFISHSGVWFLESFSFVM